MAPRIVIVGSANMDLVGLAAKLPLPGETVLGDDFVMTPGGKGANQAIAAARAGGRTVFLGAIGSDAFGVTINARLAAAGVDASGVRTTYGSSGVAVIMVDRAGENSIVVAPGANAGFARLTESERRSIAEADVLVCQLEIPVETVTEAMRAARAAGTRTILNAAPARELPPELLENIDLLVVNEVEARAITGRADLDVAALLALVPRVVVTLGGAGSRYADRDGTDSLVPAFSVEVVDSTAAGDAFTGAGRRGLGRGSSADRRGALGQRGRGGVRPQPRRLQRAADPRRDRRALFVRDLTISARLPARRPAGRAPVISGGRSPSGG